MYKVYGTFSSVLGLDLGTSGLEPNTNLLPRSPQTMDIKKQSIDIEILFLHVDEHFKV